MNWKKDNKQLISMIIINWLDPFNWFHWTHTHKRTLFCFSFSNIDFKSLNKLNELNTCIMYICKTSSSLVELKHSTEWWFSDIEMKLYSLHFYWFSRFEWHWLVYKVMVDVCEGKRQKICFNFVRTLTYSVIYTSI